MGVAVWGGGVGIRMSWVENNEIFISKWRKVY